MLGLSLKGKLVAVQLICRVANVSSSGGKLLLLEIVQRDFLSNSLCFGLLPGWWLSSENFREGCPLISETQWDCVLRESGFSGTDIVLKDTEEDDLHEISIMISTAEVTNSPIEGTEKSHVLLICESSEQIEEQLTVAISEQILRDGFKSCASVDYHNLQCPDVDIK